MKDYPLIKYVLLFIAGIIAGKFLVINFLFVFVLSVLVLFAIALLLFFSKSAVSITPISFLAYIVPLLCGYLMISSYNQNRDYLFPQSLQKEKEFTAYGKISYIELEREKEIVFECTTDSINISGYTFHREIKLICKLRDESKRKRDSVYSLIYPGNAFSLTGTYTKGRDKRNPGEFDYNKYLNEQGISGVLISYDISSFILIYPDKNVFKSFIFSIRKYIDKEITELHEPNTAALLKGLLISDRSEIDYETKTNFINSGLMHILAVSGLHVVYILIIFIFFFGRLNPYIRSSLAIIGLIIFMVVNGSPASVVRATIMAIVFIIAFLSNRTTNVYNSLALSALIILVINPNELFNPGFQLSFSAVLSMVILYPFIKKQTEVLELKPWVKKFVLFLGVTLSAQIGTLPFVLAYFSKLSLISLAVNILVVPLSGFIISIGFFTLFLNLFSPLLASFSATINELLSFIMLFSVNISGESPYSFLPVRQFSLTDALIFYIFLIIAFIFLERLTGGIKKTVFLLLITVNIIVFCSLDDEDLFAEGEINLMMIDVGQGDAILLQFPNGKTALIDAGETNSYFDNGDRIILPLLNYLGIDKIDYGFISHMDADHYSGYVSLLYKGVVKQIIKPPLDTALTYDVKFEKFVKKMKVPIQHYEQGNFKVGDVVIFTLSDNSLPGYNSFSTNNRSSLLKVVYGKTSFLFTGDIERLTEKIYERMYKQFLDSDILKVAHHGSITSSNPGFINYVSPSVSLISAGIKNKFNHPSDVVLGRLKVLNSKIHRTDLEGAILYRSNGDSIYNVDWKLAEP